MEWITANWELIAALVVPASALLAATVPDGHWSMKLINLLALNVGKARNDPKSQ